MDVDVETQTELVWRNSATLSPCGCPVRSAGQTTVVVSMANHPRVETVHEASGFEGGLSSGMGGGLTRGEPASSHHCTHLYLLLHLLPGHPGPSANYGHLD